jgi:hypothetical protein
MHGWLFIPATWSDCCEMLWCSKKFDLTVHSIEPLIPDSAFLHTVRTIASIETRLCTGRPTFRSWKGQIFARTSTDCPATSRSPIHWALHSLFCGIKSSGAWSWRSASSVEVKECVELYIFLLLLVHCVIRDCSGTLIHWKAYCYGCWCLHDVNDWGFISPWTILCSEYIRAVYLNIYSMIQKDGLTS